MVEDEQLNMRVILEPVLNAAKWAIGQGNVRTVVHILTAVITITMRLH